MVEAEIVSENKFNLLLQEAKEITNILGACIRTCKKEKLLTFPSLVGQCNF